MIHPGKSIDLNRGRFQTRIERICMSLRSSKRIYSQIALEAWFERLTSNWERFFSDEILASARLLYREGTISEIELTADDAIVHCKRKKQETYALLEWADKRLSVRSSTIPI